MSDQSPTVNDTLSASRLKQLDEVCDRFEVAWKTGQRPKIEEFLSNTPQPERLWFFRELLRLEVACRRQNDEKFGPEDYRERFPDHVEFIKVLFSEGAAQQGSTEITSSGPEPAAAKQADIPARLGAYRILGILGRGGFGTVYQGFDEELRRIVAIKVPHRHRVTRPQDVEAYLAEARILANLDHPHIVPVYHAGRTDDGSCYVVSKFIEGSDLARKIREGRPSFVESAALIATVAETLHYAHRKGLVHRDVKPGNILLDSAGHAFVTDFGSALKEEDFGKGAAFAGTPAYMSPEQARGEGHRVDGRTDVFSLGAVFYELLTGKRPFRDDGLSGLLEQIARAEPRPPRQWDDAIPKEFERVCLKALCKRARDRYPTAKDLADDLRCFLQQASAQQALPLPTRASRSTGSPSSPESPVGTVPKGFFDSDPRPLKIVPKGLRSFDADDADFFLELLPGVRDRDGMPDSVRFWKNRVEPLDPDKTFSVGLLYGPSGCGKSSLVKAGLLPRLANHVLALYVEATARETEARLLTRLRKNCPALSDDWGLSETLAALRRGDGLPEGQKVLIVLDQFEQWLHAKRKQQDTELVQALRQCDGGRVQCIVLVRDDFWMGATRFMRELEIRLVEGDNSAAVDLFSFDHARKILTAFGQAFGKLPQKSNELSKEQKEFLKQAVSGLAQEDKVICVRLALFAEMMKGKPWTPASLKEVGGTEGVGVTFLEETFSATTAPLEHRYHQQAARATLKALLPEAGTAIKGSMRSYTDLLQASGYASRPEDFDQLIRLLDNEIRLITPTDPEGNVGEEVSTAQAQAGERYYQLTHDYLVPALRDWLTRKQKETSKGRAGLRLAERAALWNAKPVSRQLPAWWEWAQIRLLTRPRDWTAAQKKMMRKADRYHATRSLVLAVALVLVGWGSYEGYGRVQAHSLRDQLLVANTEDVLPIVGKMAPYRRWIDPQLREAYQQAQANRDLRKQLHVSLALLPMDAKQSTFLSERLLEADPYEVAVLRQALRDHQQVLLERLWTAVAQPDKGYEHHRLRAACALAEYDPDNPRWANVQEALADDLLAVPAVHLATWMELLYPVQEKLQPRLQAVFRDGSRRESERSLAAHILAEWVTDPATLADLLLDADEKQFAALFPKLHEHGEPARQVLQREVGRTLLPEANNDAKESLAKRQANAAVALMHLNHPETAWLLLKQHADPRVQTYLLHRFSPLGADVGILLRRLDVEPDVTTRQALLLSVGEYGAKTWPSGERDVFVSKLRALYQTAPDAGLHAAAEWLLRQPPWQQDEWLQQTNAAWAKDMAGRQRRLETIPHGRSTEEGPARPQWYVNTLGQAMVVIPGPVEFTMGSPATEKGHIEAEAQHPMRIGRSFALAATPVTLAQFQRSPFTVALDRDRYPTPTCPMGNIDWYEAAAFCNWLSQQEGIPEAQWCYETNPAGEVVKLKANYLHLTGYRLPTEAEWEYACRAGTATSRSYGESEELLGRYAWYLLNSDEHTWPVGSKKPNAWGLFDMHGNVWNWCQDKYEDPPGTAREDWEGEVEIPKEQQRLLRGGSCITGAMHLRCAKRRSFVPTYRSWDVGFRPARTIRVE